MLAQLRAVAEESRYFEGAATQQAGVDYAAERLRLLYVGITRARTELSSPGIRAVRRAKQQSEQPAALHLWRCGIRQRDGESVRKK